MKFPTLSNIVLGIFLSSCTTTPMDKDPSPSPQSDEAVRAYSASPTPNIGFEPGTRTSVTDIDPEGDIAPLVSCKDGEIERRQSGKIICVNLNNDRSGSTMSGR